MQLKERIYITEDHSKAVHEADRRGRHLLGKKGGEITDEEAGFYGIVDGLLVGDVPLVVEVIKPKPKAKAKSKKKKTKPKAKVEEVKIEEVKIEEEDESELSHLQIVPPEVTRGKSEKVIKLGG